MNRLKTIVFLVVAVCALLPCIASAQTLKTDNFFKNIDEVNNRENGLDWGTGLTTQDPTQPAAPLGSGLLIIAAAGAGYAALRRKRTSKKGTALLLSAVMLLSMTQCKKTSVKPESTNTSSGVTMYLTAHNGDSKTTFGANGSITWNQNEKIYVVDDALGQCVGYVTNGTDGGNTFSGTINVEPGTHNFHYYYVGTVQTITDNATSFEMDFTNQTGLLVDLGKFHIGRGIQKDVVVIENTPITAEAAMTSLVSVAYFNTTGMAESGEKVYLYGDNINNKITINFSNNSVSYSKSNGGWICTGAVSSGAYVMLVPNHNNGSQVLNTDITFASKRTTGNCNNMFPYGIVGNCFYCDGGNTNSPIALGMTGYAKGILRGQFIVNSAGNKKVRFSQGNLQYIGSAATPYWKFADNQYTNLGTSTGQNSTNTNVDRDLFGYGANGYNNGSAAYQPYSTSQTDGDYYTSQLYENTDWGYNKIQNGGNANDLWRTLTYEEWGWFTNKNSFGYGRVHGVRGAIVLPVGWNSELCSGFVTGYNNTWPNTFNDNTTPTWAQMEAAGCLFLPASGWRNGIGQQTSNDCGYYWSSINSNSAGSSYALKMETGRFDANTMYRHFGLSVRLVRN